MTMTVNLFAALLLVVAYFSVQQVDAIGLPRIVLERELR